MRWDSGSYKGPNLENISKLTHPWDFVFYKFSFCKLDMIGGKIMKKILFPFLFLSIVFFIGCEDDEPNYTECGWMEIERESSTYDIFYRVGSNGLLDANDIVRECTYIHYYKDDEEVEVKRTSGEVLIESLKQRTFNYGRL